MGLTANELIVRAAKHYSMNSYKDSVRDLKSINSELRSMALQFGDIEGFARTRKYDLISMIERNNSILQKLESNTIGD